MVTLILYNLAHLTGIIFAALGITWFCFTKAVKMFDSVFGRGPDGLPCGWWEYPFVVLEVEEDVAF